MHRVVREDNEYIWGSLTPGQRSFFGGRSVLVTGCGGFLGYTFLNFFAQHAERLGLRRVIGIDSFLLGRPEWLGRLAAETPTIEVHQADIRNIDLDAVPGAGDADVVIHMASIASPAFYRRYPIETLEANVWGVRALLEYYKARDLAGFLFFSSSEVYGDPVAGAVPTSEDYRGNVASIGPRACYDEAKRFGETLCYVYSERFGLPAVIVRPFNNYGPGMRLEDKRVPADFAQAVFHDRDIEMFSDGSPTRTFCYTADAVSGYLKALAFGKFECFNIGIDKPEISIGDFAALYQRIGRDRFGYRGAVRRTSHQEKHYLTDNPNRRCPSIEKARALLDYHPQILVDQGVERFLSFVMDKGGDS